MVGCKHRASEGMVGCKHRASEGMVGCKHRASEGVFYIGGHGCVLCQFIEPVKFAHCAFIFALRNIALDGY